MASSPTASVHSNAIIPSDRSILFAPQELSARLDGLTIIDSVLDGRSTGLAPLSPELERLCTACEETLRIADFPIRESAACAHTHDVCIDCWRQWLAVEVASKMYNQIACAQCTAIFGQPDIRVLASEEDYERSAKPRNSPPSLP